MKILVTGGAGFVGSNLIKKLLKEGHIVYSIDNYESGYHRNEHKGCTYIHMDLTWDWNVYLWALAPIHPSLKELDLIYHLGALARIQPSLDNPEYTLKQNINGTINVLEFARMFNIPVIYSGSSSIHYNKFGSPYACSKHMGEELCKLYSRVYGLNVSICRFYNVYGDSMITEGNYATVIGIFQDQYLKGKPLTIVGNGEQRRDFTHVDDIVQGLIQCGELYVKESFMYSLQFELGSGKNYSINEVAKMFNYDNIEYIPKREGEYESTLCDYSNAQKILGYVPKKDLGNYIKNWLGLRVKEKEIKNGEKVC